LNPGEGGAKGQFAEGEPVQGGFSWAWNEKFRDCHRKGAVECWLWTLANFGG
jgi:hypothetical protein